MSVKPGLRAQLPAPAGQGDCSPTESRVKEVRAQAPDRRGSAQRASSRICRPIKKQLEALKIEVGARGRERQAVRLRHRRADRRQDRGRRASRSTAAASICAIRSRKSGEHKVSGEAAAASSSRRSRSTSSPRVDLPRGRGGRGEIDDRRGRRRRRERRRRGRRRRGAIVRAARILRRASSALCKDARPAHTEGGAVARSSSTCSREVRAPEVTGSDTGVVGRRPAARSRSREGRALGAADRQLPRSTRCSTKSSPTTSITRRTRQIYQAMLAAPGRERARRSAHALGSPERREEARSRRRRSVFLAELADYEATAANVVHHARIVREQVGQAQPDPRRRRRSPRRASSRATAPTSMLDARRVADLRARPDRGAQHLHAVRQRPARRDGPRRAARCAAAASSPACRPASATSTPDTGRACSPASS